MAYWMRDDRIVLVMHYFVDAHMNTIGGGIALPRTPETGTHEGDARLDQRP